MIPLTALSHWAALNESTKHGAWTVRELMDTEPTLLIMSGSEENCRIVAVAPRALMLLARALKGGKIADQHHVNEASRLLDEAGVLWR